MKKYLLIAAAALMTLVACEEKLPVEPQTPEVEDAISLTPTSGEVGFEGGKAKTMVTSSGKWTLESKMKYDWVTPSVLEGEDGDQVTFEVLANEEEDKTAVFTFTCGKATADYTIKSVAKVLPKAVLTLKTPDKYDLGFESGTFQIKADFTLGYSNIKATLSEGADWISTGAALQGDSDTEAVFECSYEKLEGLADRTAEITIKAEGCETLFTITVKQAAERQLYVDNPIVGVDLKGGEITVPVFANVSFEATVSENWLQIVSTSSNEIKLSASALTSGSRKATVTLTQKEAVGTPLTASFSVTQSSILVKWAADMKTSRLFPAWTRENEPNFPDEGQVCPASFEALIYINEFHDGMSTIMGVEDNLLLRFGDATLGKDVLQIAAVNRTNYTVDVKLETKRWYHIAFTWAADHETGKLYIDGRLAKTITNGNIYGVPFFFPFHMAENKWRCWWYGYSFEAARYFDGYMTEFRMWTKELTAEEINAPNHFYDVAPDSKGLMTYWKMTEGKGDKISNKCTNLKVPTTPLSGQINVTNKGGESGINWVPVALPAE